MIISKTKVLHSHTQARVKERVVQNTEVGKGLVTRMAQEATPPEMDKYNLHVEEVIFLLVVKLPRTVLPGGKDHLPNPGPLLPACQDGEQPGQP